MKTCYLTFACLILTLLSINIFAQNEAKVWTFGSGAKIDFNPTTPTASYINTINTLEGSSAISDTNGNLIFYTDGVTVWDKNNNQMPNGTGLKGHSSSVQSGLIVPCSCNKYLIFTPGVMDNNYDNGLNYSVVDMTLNNGLGEVTTPITKNLIATQVSEKLAGVSDGNGNYWVVAHTIGDNNFHAFKVTTGSNCSVSTSAKISSIGTKYEPLGTPDIFSGHYPNRRFGVGTMKFSPDGTKLGVTGFSYENNGFVELFNFDRTTGAITDVNSSGTYRNVAKYYGLEFSPDSTKLYVTTSWDTSQLHQYDANAVSATTFKNSKRLIHNFPIGSLVDSSAHNGRLAQLQLAPNGRIYVARFNQSFISSINNPNVAATSNTTTVNAAAVGFTNQSIQLASGSNSKMGLPTVVAGSFTCDESPTPPAAKDHFGNSVSIWGNFAVVGAPQCDIFGGTNGSTGNGKVHIYELQSGGWTLVKTLTGQNSGDCFGRSVGISGDYVIVGANKVDVGSNQDQGAAYIYERNFPNANSWGLRKTLTPLSSDAAAGDGFGTSVAISGNNAIVGAPQAEPVGGVANQGQAYIFERNEGGNDNWGQKNMVTAVDNVYVNDYFGQSVAISGVTGTAVVGSILHDEPMKVNQGAAYVFQRTNGSWSQTKKLFDPNGAADDYYGCSVSITNLNPAIAPTIIVGAFQADGTKNNQGAAYIYYGSNWAFQTKLTSPSPEAGDNFGYSVGIWNNWVVIGAYNDEINPSDLTTQNQGVAYFSSKNQNNGAWSVPVAKSGSPSGNTDLFGSGVAIFGNWAIIGAPLNDVGTNINQGAAYIFTAPFANQVVKLNN
ncbi:MAG: FG-GAP repeat protein [Pyrinomonadaceae bacterium]|nr:FG-GAP repeat protein [Pyrinomonadaceae bacterium]